MIRVSKSLRHNLYCQIAQKNISSFSLCNGDKTQEAWKPLLNTLLAFRGLSECFAQ